MLLLKKQLNADGLYMIDSTSIHPESVSVIIVTYQSKDIISATLSSLTKLENKALLKIIVIDNASTDGTAECIEKEFPAVMLIRNSYNIGFGRGCNQGFLYVKTPFVLLLNPDAVIDINSIMVLVKFMKKTPKAGICGPAVKEASGNLQPSGGRVAPWKIILKPLLPRMASRGQHHVVPGEEPRLTDWICGSVMLIRYEMIKKIGTFDPRFFLYFEETDLIIRTQQAGWEIWTVGKATAEHVNAASAKATQKEMIWGTIAEHYFRSRFYFLKKHYGLLQAILAETGELVCMIIRSVLDIIRGRSYNSVKLRIKAPFFKYPTGPEEK